VILPSECVGVEKMEMAMILPSAHNIRILYFVLTHVIVLTTERKCVTIGLNLNV